MCMCCTYMYIMYVDRYTFPHYFYRQFNIAASLESIYSLTHSLTHSLIAQHLFLPMSSSLNSHSSSMTDDTLIIHSGTPLSVGDDQVRATHSLTPLLHHSLTPPYSLPHSLPHGRYRATRCPPYTCLRRTCSLPHSLTYTRIHSLIPLTTSLRRSLPPSLPPSLTHSLQVSCDAVPAIHVSSSYLFRSAEKLLDVSQGKPGYVYRRYGTHSLTHSLTHTLTH